MIDISPYQGTYILIYVDIYAIRFFMLWMIIGWKYCYFWFSHVVFKNTFRWFQI